MCKKMSKILQSQQRSYCLLISDLLGKWQPSPLSTLSNESKILDKPLKVTTSLNKLARFPQVMVISYQQDISIKLLLVSDFKHSQLIGWGDRSRLRQL